MIQIRSSSVVAEYNAINIRIFCHIGRIRQKCPHHERMMRCPAAEIRLQIESGTVIATDKIKRI